MLKRRIKRGVEIWDTLCSIAGLSRSAQWADVLAEPHVRLYAGKLRRTLPQYKTHTGLTPFFASKKNIHHDVSAPYPIADETVDVYQSEDVFEHVPLSFLPTIFDEIYRILKPNGLFRLSLPDYNFDLYRDRSEKAEDGSIIFDPGGGGKLVDGKIVNGGHLWFPTIDLVREVFERSKFGNGPNVNYLHYHLPDGSFVCDPIDYSLGNIQRTPDFDPRVADRPRPLSIIVDARKPSR